MNLLRRKAGTCPAVLDTFIAGQRFQCTLPPAEHDPPNLHRHHGPAAAGSWTDHGDGSITIHKFRTGPTPDPLRETSHGY